MHPKKALILYDDDCGFCTACVRIIRKLDRKGRFDFMEGSDSAELRKEMGISGYAQPLESVLLLQDGHVHERSDAVIKILAGTGGIARLSVVFYLVPRFLRDALYRLIARNRYLFGGSGSCRRS